MKTPKIKFNKSSNDSEKSDDSHAENDAKKDAGRRIQDGIISKSPNRKLNLDRRTVQSERRGNTDPNYKGPSRRYTIDRRLNLKDRREKE